MDEKGLEKALFFEQKAVYYEQARFYQQAVFCYGEAAKRLMKLLKEKACLPIFRKNVERCVDRGEFLKKNMSIHKNPPGEKDTGDLVEFMVLKASVFMEEESDRDEALKIFEDAISLCLKASSGCDDRSKRRLKGLAEEALGRAEQIQKWKIENEVVLKLPDVPVDELSKMTFSTTDEPSSSTAPSASPVKLTFFQAPGPAQKYTSEELAVLSITSNINKKLYVPFHAYDKVNEFQGKGGKFSDPDGKIGLTAKQKSKLKQWKRASELFTTPVVISAIDSASIKQTIISDCSFISSLSIAALYEKKFKKQLVTSRIYPQNAHGQPIYNPDGKYMIKFHINGVWRKVVIDDYFPVDEHDQMMCSQSERKGELWVSLMEKAYMKIMGGYDFPGSNSNIDLNALTGWIPERISIRKNSAEFEEDVVFKKLFERMHRGDCLVTLATGRLTKDQCDRAGLVETHAYAVLDMRCVENVRLLKLKNPWTHLRWKGNYSEKDKVNWTPKMKQSLGYDLEAAAAKDDGVFWIDYDSVIHFFDVFYVNWNPELFPFTWVYHATWSSCAGPVKDLYTVGDNPQYLLTVNTGQMKAAAVWILLTRHITRIDDFAENKEYITVMVYDTGKKVYIPSDPKPILDGARINSPHYLCQLKVTKPGVSKYTLVVAQYEKTTTIHYSIRVYSTVDVSFETIKSPYVVTKTITGVFDGAIEPEKKYPIMKLTLHSKTDDVALLMELKAPRAFSVAIEMKQISSDRTVFYESKNTGPYRPGYTIIQLENVPAGVYYVRLATYTPGQKGPFILRVDSTCKFDIEQLKL